MLIVHFQEKGNDLVVMIMFIKQTIRMKVGCYKTPIMTISHSDFTPRKTTFLLSLVVAIPLV